MENLRAYHTGGQMSPGGAATKADYEHNMYDLGGVDPGVGLTMARYRMAKLGLPDVPVGPREVADTVETKNARNYAKFHGTDEEKKAAYENARIVTNHEAQGHFDMLFRKPTHAPLVKRISDKDFNNETYLPPTQEQLVNRGGSPLSNEAFKTYVRKTAGQ